VLAFCFILWASGHQNSTTLRPRRRASSTPRCILTRAPGKYLFGFRIKFALDPQVADYSTPECTFARPPSESLLDPPSKSLGGCEAPQVSPLTPNTNAAKSHPKPNPSTPQRPNQEIKKLPPNRQQRKFVVEGVCYPTSLSANLRGLSARHPPHRKRTTPKTQQRNGAPGTSPAHAGRKPRKTNRPQTKKKKQNRKLVNPQGPSETPQEKSVPIKPQGAPETPPPRKGGP
jgi:hypothetical protein